MTHPLRPLVVVWALVQALCGLAWADDGPQQPYELVRGVQMLQDKVAQGNATAHVGQRTLLAKTAERLEAADSAVWKDQRNARAVIIFALSGGSPRVLRKLLAAGADFGVDEKIARAALAYAEGRNKEAADLLAAFDARTLDPSIAGHVALVQGELLVEKSAERAIVALDHARLLSPGTLIEEAALRRQAALHAAADSYEMLEATCAVYFRRFPQSIFAPSLKQEFALGVAKHLRGDDAGRLQKLGAMLGSLESAEQRDFYLLIARQSVASGNVVMIRFASTNAAGLAEGTSVAGARSKVYEAAALIVTDEFERGRASLQSTVGASLPTEDSELLEAAVSLADQVRSPFEPGSGGGTPVLTKRDEPQTVSGAGAEPKVLVIAQQAVTNVDKLLSGAK